MTLKRIAEEIQHSKLKVNIILENVYRKVVDKGFRCLYDTEINNTDLEMNDFFSVFAGVVSFPSPVLPVFRVLL